MTTDPTDDTATGPCAAMPSATHDRGRISYEGAYRCPVCEIPAFEAAMRAQGRGLSACGRWRDTSDDTATDEDPVDDEDGDDLGAGDLEDQFDRLLCEQEGRGLADAGVGTYSELARRDGD